MTKAMYNNTVEQMANVQSDLSKFPWKCKSRNHKKLVEDFLNAYQTVRCHMSLKIHFLHSNLDFFPPNLPAVSDKHWEKFRQEFSTMEKDIRKAFTQHVSWLLLERYWTVVYYQLQMNELQKEVLNMCKIEHIFSYFCYKLYEVILIQHSYRFF